MKLCVTITGTINPNTSTILPRGNILYCISTQLSLKEYTIPHTHATKAIPHTRTTRTKENTIISHTTKTHTTSELEYVLLLPKRINTKEYVSQRL